VEKGQRLTLVEMAGSATITAWSEDDILIRLREGRAEDLVVEQGEAGPAVSVRQGCEVQVPSGMAVEVRQAQGNLRVAGPVDLNAEQIRGNLQLSQTGQVTLAEVYGNLKADAAKSLRLIGTAFGDAKLDDVSTADLQNVRGNLQVRGSVSLRASRVGGNLQAKSLAGTLDIDRVGGNATLKNVAGTVTVGQVAGNLAAKYLSGGAKVGRIGGNLGLDGDLGTGCTYHFNADGNAWLCLSEQTGAHLTLVAGGQLLSRLKLADEERSGTRLSGTLGGGGNEIVVEAGGNILAVAGEAVPDSDWGDDLARQIEESLRAIDVEAITRQVSQEMDAAMSRLKVKLETVDWERMGSQTQKALERAMDRIQKDMDRAAAKAAHHAEQFQRRAERAARYAEHRERRRSSTPYQNQDVPVDVPGSPPEDLEPEPSLDEERLSILRMVEQGQITPEEAEMLLDALQ
jgi:hypothetical protein